MPEYLNKGRLIKESVDMRDSSQFIAFGPKKTLSMGCRTLHAVTTPEYKLNFSFSYTKTHTYSCMRADVFSGVFA